MRRIAVGYCKISCRGLSSTKSIQEVLKDQVPQKLEALKQLRKTYGPRSLGSYTVDQCLGGGRDIKCMYYETSLLDPLEGIRFRGFSIPELQSKLPSACGVPGQGQPTPEGLLWLLLTSEIPSTDQAKSISDELRARSSLPSHVEALLLSLPKTMHPMAQLSIGLLACQPDSKFVKAHRGGTIKSKYWESVLEDVLDVIAKLPSIAAIVYRHSFKDGRVVKDFPAGLDYSARFNRMLGFDSSQFDELMRMYLVIHADHEGGNASAHATHLAGSTLSDPYLAFSAGLNALAGPLHGLANQEVLSWIQQLQAKFSAEGKAVNRDTITAFAWETLRAGKVIPGYGHAVLRRTDPRYECQRQFALQHLPHDPLFQIVSTIYEVMPGVLTEHGKTKNPYPNVDSHSGVLLWHYGLREYQYYTVLFGVSRAIGALSQLVWDRALQLPLENPKSVDMDFVVNYFANKKS